MNIRKALAICLLALVPALALSTPMTIISMPTDDTGGNPNPLRHNVFHDATLPGGAGGAVLAWFDLDNTMTSTWDPATGDLILNVSIFSNSDGTGLLGTGSAVGNLDFGVANYATLGFLTWTFNGGAAGVLGAGLAMEFINRTYGPFSDTAGNLPNTQVGNTVTLWGADGMHDGNGFFDGALLGVDMVFVVPEPAIILLMAMGLLGIGVSARRR